MSNLYTIVVSTTDRKKFVEELLEWGSKGAKLDGGIPRLNRIPYSARLDFYSEKKIPTGNFLTHLVLEKHLTYTKQELEDLTIDELREVSKVYGITGRDKTQIIREVLPAQDAYLKEKGLKEMQVALATPADVAKQSAKKEAQADVAKQATPPNSAKEKLKKGK